uniref:Uncharacterized protein n=1 Tax=Anguilla anguilla TaxID=7936 RepID=A0A0E9T3B1_ANGAN
MCGYWRRWHTPVANLPHGYTPVVNLPHGYTPVAKVATQLHT